MNKAYQTIVIVVCFVGGLLTAYWAWKYEGLYRWLAEWQLRTFGSYEAQLTVIFTGVIVIGPPMLALVIVRRFHAGADAAPFASPGPAASPAPPSQRGEAIQRWLYRWGWAIFVASIGLFLAVPGVYHLHRGRTAGEVTRVTAADFDAGRVPSRSWVLITGDAIVDQAVSISTSSSGKATFYVPVISENYDPARGVTLFLKASAEDINDDVRRFGDGRFEGMLTTSSLPGMARVEFERRKAPPAKGYRVLDLGRTPADDIRVGRDMVIFGGAILAAGVVIALWPWWSNRREAVRPVPVATTAATASPAPAGDPRFKVKAILPLGAQTPKDPSI